MTREEEIEQAANGYLDSLFGGGRHHDLYIRLFMAGARWADQHTKDNFMDIDEAWDWLTNQKGEHTKEDFIKAMKGEYQL